MYEKAKYYRNRFIRNGIAGLAISAFIIYKAICTDKDFTLASVVFPVAALAWLYFGLRINKKLKTKVPTNEITDERLSFRQIEYALSFLILASLLLSFRHWQYANYLIVIVLLVYGIWFYKQMKSLNNYFNS
jgi:hypothetical protein